MYCYRSLINGGYLNPDNRLATVCENIRICGKGTVYGGGNELGTAMKQIYADKEKYPQYVSDGMGGRRTRGRLLGFIQCKNVELTGINVENPSCWTIHMIYCDTVTTHGINIKSRGIDNGDGWDPDSSRNCMIFDTSFDTGDDCIAIKSGKNPDGNKINIPAKNIRIFDLNMLGGHGMAIGSEESGGVENVSLRDCKIRNTDYGLELKAHNSRGGYIKNLTMQDCEIDRFMAHSVNYNADGIAAPTLPYFKDITIKNTTIDGTGRAIELIGFTQSNSQDDTNYLSNVNLQNVTLGTKADKDKEIYLEKARDITLTNVKLANGGDPTINLDQETVHGLVVDGKTVQ
jgi:exo-poly-alpha-galacturonosidase